MAVSEHEPLYFKVEVLSVDACMTHAVRMTSHA
jgi:hypothetical protein